MPIFLITLIKFEILPVKFQRMMLNSYILVFTPGPALTFVFREILNVNTNRNTRLAT